MSRDLNPDYVSGAPGLIPAGTGDLFRSSGGSGAPLLVRSEALNHVHETNVIPWAVPWHTNNMTPNADTTYHLTIGDRSTGTLDEPTGVHRMFILNSDATFTLNMGAAGTIRESVGDPKYRNDGAYPTQPRNRMDAYTGHDSYNTWGIHHELWLTFIQDNVANRQFGIRAWGNSTGGANTPGTILALGNASATPNQTRTLHLRWLGPFVGWIIALDTGWQTGKHEWSESAAYAGSYFRSVRGLGHTDHATWMAQVLQTPVNYRKALYRLGVTAVNAQDGNQINFLRQMSGSSEVVGSAVTTAYFGYDKWLIYCTTKTSPVGATLHEQGHAADFTLLRAKGYDLNVNQHPDVRRQYIKAIRTGQVPALSSTHYRTPTEWMAQVLGTWAHRKYLVANAMSTTAVDTDDIPKVLPNTTIRDETYGVLDTVLAGFY